METVYVVTFRALDNGQSLQAIHRFGAMTVRFLYGVELSPISSPRVERLFPPRTVRIYQQFHRTFAPHPVVFRSSQTIFQYIITLHSDN